MPPLFHTRTEQNDVTAGAETAWPGEMDFIRPPVKSHQNQV